MKFGFWRLNQIRWNEPIPSTCQRYKATQMLISTFSSRVPQHGVGHHHDGPPEDVSQDEDVKLL